jgi:hypothetical protein
MGQYLDRFFFSAGGFGDGPICPGKYLVKSNPLLWLLQQNSVVNASLTTTAQKVSLNLYGIGLKKACKFYHQGACHHYNP